MENIPELNQRVKDARLFLKLNQRAVCKKLDINPSYYSGVESGKRKVTSRIIEGYTKFFGVSTDWLYTGNGEMMLTKSTHSSTLNDVPPLYPSQSDSHKIDTKAVVVYIRKFEQFLKENHPDYYKLTEDIYSIFELKDVLENLEYSKIGKAVYFGMTVKDIKNYEQYKDTGLQSIKDIFQHNHFIHQFAEFARIFALDLNIVKNEIDYKDIGDTLFAST